MTVAELLHSWTHLYHVTHIGNLQSIRTRGQLLPAAAIFLEAGAQPLAMQRRTTDVVLRLDRDEVIVRNQSPLNPDALDLEGGTLDAYVQYLNERTYFWPGTELGPVDDGVRLADVDAAAVVIRVPSRALLEANATTPLEVSSCNSGAAWTVDGRRCRRGVDVFVPLDRFGHTAADIVEISFTHAVRLPPETRYRVAADSPWQPLFGP